MTPTYASPNTFVAWAPAPAAPTVCAIVLRLRMADSGRSMLSFRALSLGPVEPPFRSRTARYEGVTLSNTASRIEHRKETARARLT